MEIKLSRKIIIVLCIIFIFLCLYGIYFFVKLRESTKLQIQRKTTETLTFSDNLIPGINENAKQGRYFDAVSLLKKTVPDRLCFLTPRCVEINHPFDLWYTEIYQKEDGAFPIKGPFVVNLSLQGKEEMVGISLFGRLSKSETLWWKDISTIFIGIGNNGYRLYVDVKDGSSEIPSILIDTILSKGVSQLKLFFDEKGKQLLITDNEYKPIVTIDINLKTNNKFPLGLFPDNKIYPAFSVSPNSYLALYEFSIVPIQK